MATRFPNQVQVKPIHFFKIITYQNLEKGKLMFPNKFVEKYGEGIPNTLFLKTPNGAEWKLNLEKRNGKIWFELEGWKEFAEYHSLSHGYLLVFKCQRTSHFQVHIFDLRAIEIDYPPKRIEGKTAFNNHGNKTPIEENLEYHRPGQKRKDNSAVDFLQSYQLRSPKSVKVENTVILLEALHHTDTNCKEKSKAAANQVTALDRASSFKSCYPFFLVVLHPSYVGFHHQLNLPLKFCWKHFDFRMKNGLVNLQVLDGRVWPAKLLIHENKTSKKFRLSWWAFVKSNNLKVGDVCTVELIDRTKLTFLVHIFRETEKENSNCSTSQESGQIRAACQGQKKDMKTITATKQSSPKSFSSVV